MEDYILKYLNETKVKFDMLTLVKASVILVVTVAAVIALTVIHKRIMSRAKRGGDLRKPQVYRISFRILRAFLIIAGLLALLQAVGINVTVLSAGFAVAVAFILLAVKDALEDVFSGANIVLDRFFSVGDAVEFEGKEGIVISFTARTTKIELLEDRTVLTVANRHISKIRKLNHLVDIDLPIPYELSRQEVFPVLEEICRKICALDGIESCELKGTQEFAASAILYKIRFFCEPHDRPDIRRAVMKTIQDELEIKDIHIPYQQIDIHER